MELVEETEIRNTSTESKIVVSANIEIFGKKE
jgi:hypothetical protein